MYIALVYHAEDNIQIVISEQYVNMGIFTSAQASVLTIILLLYIFLYQM